MYNDKCNKCNTCTMINVINIINVQLYRWNILPQVYLYLQCWSMLIQYNNNILILYLKKR